MTALLSIVYLGALTLALVAVVFCRRVDNPFRNRRNRGTTPLIQRLARWRSHRASPAKIFSSRGTAVGNGKPGQVPAESECKDLTAKANGVCMVQYASELLHAAAGNHL